MSKFHLNTITNEKGISEKNLIEIVDVDSIIPRKFKLSLKLTDELTKLRFIRIPTFEEGTQFKLQKICHDDSTPPYDSYCSYCSASRSCNSKDFRAVTMSETDEISIEAIQKEEKYELIKEKFKTQFADKVTPLILNELLAFFEEHSV